VRLWRIPEGGLPKDTQEPSLKVAAHTGRVNVVGFHPLAEGVLVTAGMDNPAPTMKYWDAATGTLLQTLTGFGDLVFGWAHSFDGGHVAVVSKDGRLRVFDARTGTLLREGAAHEGTRGARVVWLGATGRLATLGWNKSVGAHIHTLIHWHSTCICFSVSLSLSFSLALGAARQGE
jgi:WD40 repeat protein